MESDQPAEQKPPDFSVVDNILALESNEFQSAFGESVDNTLDINTWQVGEDLASMYQKLEEEVAKAVEQGGRIRERIRAELFPFVFERAGAPECAGFTRLALLRLSGFTVGCCSMAALKPVMAQVYRTIRCRLRLPR